MGPHPFAAACGLLVLIYVGRWLARGYAFRKVSHDKPGPPHSWILGHLKAMGGIAMSHPLRVHPHVLIPSLRKKFNLGSFFYLDIWPASDPLIVIVDPKIAQQLSVEYQALKHPTLPDFMIHLAGKDDMVSSNGQDWQPWRRMFNPGFSTQHLNTLIPGIVDDVLIYAEKLSEYAERKQVFRLEEETTRLTIDVIGKVTLDLNFNMQRGDNPCIEALREQVQLLPNAGAMAPFEMWHPVGIYKRWRNSRIMRNYIGKVLDDRFATIDSKTPKKQKKRTIIDLALDSYISGVETDLEAKTDISAPAPKMDKKFREGAITQIRIFLFAGHDTTSSLMCYVFYMLRKHPACAAKIRREHDEILGPIEGAADAIKSQPALLNKLEYTMCVIKETLRLFPPASAPRKGEPNLKIRDPETGKEYPTDGWLLWIVHYGLHRSEEVWGKDVLEFKPSRFLPENSAKIPEGAWRPFEMGLRNCLGQNLALLESRIILALTVRSFEFDLAIHELDELKNDGSFYARNEIFRQGVQDVDGEEMYQILLGAAKPREGMPVRVRKV